MDLTSPVVMAAPPFVAGCAIVLLGAIGPRRLRLFVASVGGFVILCSVLGALVNICIHVSKEEPLWVGVPLLAIGLVCAALIGRAAIRARRDDPGADTDGDGEGGSGVRIWTPPPAGPAPAGPPPDWREFDELREDWSRAPVAG